MATLAHRSIGSALGTPKAQGLGPVRAASASVEQDEEAVDYDSQRNTLTVRINETNGMSATVRFTPRKLGAYLLHPAAQLPGIEATAPWPWFLFFMNLFGGKRVYCAIRMSEVAQLAASELRLNMSGLERALANGPVITLETKNVLIRKVDRRVADNKAVDRMAANQKVSNPRSARSTSADLVLRTR